MTPSANTLSSYRATRDNLAEWRHAIHLYTDMSDTVRMVHEKASEDIVIEKRATS